MDWNVFGKSVGGGIAQSGNMLSEAIMGEWKRKRDLEDQERLADKAARRQSGENFLNRKTQVEVADKNAETQIAQTRAQGEETRKTQESDRSADAALKQQSDAALGSPSLFKAMFGAALPGASLEDSVQGLKVTDVVSRVRGGEALSKEDVAFVKTLPPDAQGAIRSLDYDNSQRQQKFELDKAQIDAYGSFRQATLGQGDTRIDDSRINNAASALGRVTDDIGKLETELGNKVSSVMLTPDALRAKQSMLEQLKRERQTYQDIVDGVASRGGNTPPPAKEPRSATVSIMGNKMNVSEGQTFTIPGKPGKWVWDFDKNGAVPAK